MLGYAIVDMFFLAIGDDLLEPASVDIVTIVFSILAVADICFIASPHAEFKQIRVGS